MARSMTGAAIVGNAAAYAMATAMAAAAWPDGKEN